MTINDDIDLPERFEKVLGPKWREKLAYALETEVSGDAVCLVAVLEFLEDTRASDWPSRWQAMRLAFGDKTFDPKYDMPYFQDRYEAPGVNGTEVINVATGVPNWLLNDIAERRTTFDEAVSWWQQWGRRFHIAWCEMVELTVLGHDLPDPGPLEHTTTADAVQNAVLLMEATAAEHRAKGWRSSADKASDGGEA